MPPIRRRNGRKPACEPCRRRKLACDHGFPSCARCQKQSVTCVYLESPSKQAGSECQQSCGLPSQAFPAESTNSSILPLRSSQGLSSSTSLTSLQPTSVLGDSAEYLGPTSFTSVFFEHSEHFEVDRALESSRQIGQSRSAGREMSFPGTIDPPLRGFELHILESIPDEESCNALFSKHVNPNDGWIRLAGQRLSDSMWHTIDKLPNQRSPSNLLDLARLISKRTCRDLAPQENPQHWILSFSGENLRWEALGILFTYWAFGAISSSPESEILSRYNRENSPARDLKQLMLRMKHYAWLCMELCKQLSCANVLLVYLMYKHNILESIIHGDKSLSCWRQHGELVAVTTSLGLHRELPDQSKKVTIYHEEKRRVFAAVFNIDKVLSTFTGRPPLLSRAYSTTALPLDISDEVLMSDHCKQAVESLDARGWNQNGCINSVTILRARTMFAALRDEILELVEVARSPMPDSVAERVSRLKATSRDIYENLPACIVYKNSDLDQLDTPGDDLYARILTRLEHLLNLFLIERLIQRNIDCVHQKPDLIDTSREMLSLTLIFWKHTDRFLGLHSDFEWLVMSYAVPASGILCLELLRQARNPKSYSLVLPRSEIIQNLSLLVGFLDWVRPMASSRNMNVFISHILNRVLDRILDAPTTLTGSIDMSNDLLDPSLLGWASCPPEYPHLELLHTFDWIDWTEAVPDT